MAVVVIVEASEGLPARHAEDRLDGPVVLHHLEVGHPTPYAVSGRHVHVVVGFDELHMAARAGGTDAPEVDELVPLDRFPAARVLPATHLHDDVHRGT